MAEVSCDHENHPQSELDAAGKAVTTFNPTGQSYWDSRKQKNSRRAKPLAFAADAGCAMGLQSIFALKPLSEAGFAEEQLWIDVSMNASPGDDLTAT